jgi:L-threonate 2-dehydrogenase
LDKIGIIGVGVMGAAMAGRLVNAGFQVVGYDIDEKRIAELRRRGGSPARSCAEVVHKADVVLTSLPSVAAFEHVVSEIAATMPDGGPLVVMETSTLPLEVKDHGRTVLADRGVTLLDCPLSGTGRQAEEGDVVVYASGDQAAIERLGPVFVGFARGWYFVGEFGAGSKMKFVANLLVAIHNVAAAEALVLARSAGLDLRSVLDVVSDGAGTSRMFEVRGPLMVSGNFADAGIRTSTFQKDIDIISAFARRSHCPLPLFATASQLYAAILAQGRGDQDPSCLFDLISEMAGIVDSEETHSDP